MKVLALGHSASRTGSPKVFTGILEWIARQEGTEVDVVLAEGGPFASRIQESVRSLTVLNEQALVARTAALSALMQGLQLDKLARQLSDRASERPRATGAGYDAIYVNSVSALGLLRKQRSSTPVLLHVHELDYAVDTLAGDAEPRPLNDRADAFIAVSDSVARMLVDRHGVRTDQVVRVPGCLLDEDLAAEPLDQQESRKSLGLDPDRALVVGCGTLEWRKGEDIFLATAARHTRRYPDELVTWVWVGASNTRAIVNFRREIGKADLAERVRVVEATPEVRRWMAAADLLLLSSREDPYPLVALEAALAGRPLVCQRQSGGAPEFAERGAGLTCDYLDIEQLAFAVHRLVTDAALAQELGRRGRELVLAEHSVSVVAPVVYSKLVALKRGSQAPGAW